MLDAKFIIIILDTVDDASIFLEGSIKVPSRCLSNTFVPWSTTVKKSLTDIIRNWRDLFPGLLDAKVESNLSAMKPPDSYGSKIILSLWLLWLVLYSRRRSTTQAVPRFVKSETIKKQKDSNPRRQLPF